MPKHPTLIALIPSRAGSKRLHDKNIRPLAGHPLMAYTIAVALQSQIFAAVIVSTDSDQYADIARYYGAEIPFLRPSELAGDLSPDIEWVTYTLKRLQNDGRTFDSFSILRPTSPFRQAETIIRAWQEFLSQDEVDSLRAVEKCSQHPGKMWIVNGNRMTPLLSSGTSEHPWHSTPYQALPEVYAQNASLEIAWSRVVFEGHTIAGNEVMPFFTKDYEGFDVNQSIDWQIAEELVRTGKVSLPSVPQTPFSMKEASR